MKTADEILCALNEVWLLEDLVYDIREYEGEGWEGPLVKEWSDLCMDLSRYTASNGLPDWKQRVRNEFFDLEIRVHQLHTFIFESDEHSELSKEDQHLLNEQLTYMIAYKKVLEERVNRWNDET